MLSIPSMRNMTVEEAELICKLRKEEEENRRQQSEPAKLTPHDREQRTRLRVECVEMALRSQSSGMNSGVMTDETITRRAQSIFDWITA